MGYVFDVSEVGGDVDSRAYRWESFGGLCTLLDDELGKIKIVQSLVELLPNLLPRIAAGMYERDRTFCDAPEINITVMCRWGKRLSRYLVQRVASWFSFYLEELPWGRGTSFHSRT